jgi:hypothetical protein
MAGTRIDPKAKERFAELHGLGCTQHESARAVGLHTPGKPVVLVPLVTVPDSATG